jgi:hypothetical protein
MSLRSTKPVHVRVHSWPLMYMMNHALRHTV